MQTMLNQVAHRAHSYIKNAGTYILVAAIVIWFGSNFPQVQTEDVAARLEHSYMGQMGKWIEPVIAPLGFDWKIGVALVAGFAAKEVVVSTMSTIYHVGNAAVDSTQALQAVLRADPVYTPATVMALLVFILVYLPCISATSVFHVEAGAWRYTLSLIVYTTGLAWLLSFVTYRLVDLFF
jgi:ferrous iron transport protein B